MLAGIMYESAKLKTDFISKVRFYFQEYYSICQVQDYPTNSTPSCTHNEGIDRLQAYSGK
jgi:hypothetical protein